MGGGEEAEAPRTARPQTRPWEEEAYGEKGVGGEERQDDESR